MTPCTNITIHDILKSSSGVSIKNSSRLTNSEYRVNDALQRLQNTPIPSPDAIAHEGNSEESNSTLQVKRGRPKSKTSGRANKGPPKTAAERVREYRARQKLKGVPEYRARQKLKRVPKPKTKIPKTGAERARKYREKKKLLALAARQNGIEVSCEGTSSVATEVENCLNRATLASPIDTKSILSSGGGSVLAPPSNRKKRRNGPPAKTGAQRAREYRARRKLLLEVKKVPKTCAERAREYRARKKQSSADARSSAVIRSVEVEQHSQRGVYASVFNLSPFGSYGFASAEGTAVSAAERARVYRARLLPSAYGPASATAVIAERTPFLGNVPNTAARKIWSLEPAVTVKEEYLDGHIGDAEWDYIYSPETENTGIEEESYQDWPTSGFRISGNIMSDGDDQVSEKDQNIIDDQSSGCSERFNMCPHCLLHGTQSTDSNQSTPKTQEIGDIMIKTYNDQDTSNSRQIVRMRVANKTAARNRLYRERHREEINQRRRDLRHCKKKSHQIHTLSNIANNNQSEQITHATSNGQQSPNSNAQRQRQYYQRNKEEINKRKRDRRLQRNVSRSIPATAAERARAYRERNRQKINERRRDSRQLQRNSQQGNFILETLVNIKEEPIEEEDTILQPSSSIMQIPLREDGQNEDLKNVASSTVPTIKEEIFVEEFQEEFEEYEDNPLNLAMV